MHRHADTRLNTLLKHANRNLKAYDRKVTKAKAKQNRELAQKLLQLKPTYQLDHLVKER